MANATVCLCFSLYLLYAQKLDPPAAVATWDSPPPTPETHSKAKRADGAREARRRMPCKTADHEEEPLEEPGGWLSGCLPKALC